MKSEDICFGRKAMTDIDRVLKSRDITLLTKVHIVKAMVFPVVTYVYESWTTRKAEPWRTDAFELWCWKRLLRVSWTARRSNQSILREINWIFIGRADADAETPVFWSSDVNSWLIAKVPDAGKDWGQKEKRASEDEMTGWNHHSNGHKFGQTLGQRGLVCCGPWGCKESDMTGWVNNNIASEIRPLRLKF